MEFKGLGADEIKHNLEVEVLLITRDNRAEVLRKASNWLMEGVN
jgi:hypothetical protein